jgi:hypothetical protein
MKLIPTLVAEWVFFVHEYVYSLGRHDEDGEERFAKGYTVVAEGKSGERFAHTHSFRGTNVNHEHEMEAAAGRLMARVQAAQKAGSWKGPVDNENWVPMEPCYGSEAYVAGNWEAYNAYLEKREEGIDCEPPEFDG